MKDLLALLQAAGHHGFRDARGPMGFTQRQGAGKFTRDEAEELITRLQETRDKGDAGPRAEAIPRPSPAELLVRRLPAEQLARELKRRGWHVVEP